MLHGETICALSSAIGAGDRAVLRLSGEEALSLAGCVFAASSDEPPHAWTAFRRHPGELRLPGWPTIKAAAYVFRAPRSYTREDMVELHILGLPPLVSATLRALQARGARQAEAGEFTRRAFLNGRLDLTQAEAVLALTSSEAASEARLAARSLSGGIGERIDAAKTRLLGFAAQLEAGIDFSEDEVELMPVLEATALLDSVSEALSKLERSASRFLLHDSEAVVVLSGPANAGKSTLFNRLCGVSRSITSSRAGTTRDAVDHRRELDGRPLRLIDLAGERETEDPNEQDAINLAKQTVTNADLVIAVRPWHQARPASDRTADSRTIHVASKCEQTGAAPLLEDPSIIATSGHTGLGVARLEQAIIHALSRQAAATSVGRDFLTSARQLALIENARRAIARARVTLLEAGDARWELGMIDIYDALDALGEITGAVATDDILDAIFGQFCIGK